MFAASQSPTGQILIRQYGILEMASYSIILISHGRVFIKSAAALKIARRLRGFWPLFYVFIILPRPFRDYIYELLARNRYRIYGKRKQCFIPDPGIRDRFLEPY
jgi:predicted DCC family thiol-disulfide oxidoreductase YuxK